LRFSENIFKVFFGENKFLLSISVSKSVRSW